MNTIRRQCGMSKNSENRAERDSSNVYWKVEGVRNVERKISRIERSEIRVTFNLRLKECEILSERKNRDPSDGVFGYVWLGCGWGVAGVWLGRVLGVWGVWCGVFVVLRGVVGGVCVLGRVGCVRAVGGGRYRSPRIIRIPVYIRTRA